MSKRRQGQDCNCGKRPRPRRWHKHLYVVLDDCKNGYSIHKLDVHSFLSEESDDDDDRTAGLRRLPEPPAIRLAQACHENMFFAALGSNIVIANNTRYHAQPPALLYDTEAATLNMGPRLPVKLRSSLVITIPATAAAAGEMQQQQLYALACEYHGNQKLQVSLEVMSWARSPADIDMDPYLPSHEWSWEGVPAPPAPFDGNKETITSFVVHPDPDGHTIFISTQDTFNRRRNIGTYSFDTKRFEWRSHGEWVLPFKKQGYFDRELDAWVGLHKDGYICSCQVAASRSSSSTSTQQPD